MFGDTRSRCGGCLVTFIHSFIPHMYHFNNQSKNPNSNVTNVTNCFGNQTPSSRLNFFFRSSSLFARSTMALVCLVCVLFAFLSRVIYGREKSATEHRKHSFSSSPSSSSSYLFFSLLFFAYSALQPLLPSLVEFFFICIIGFTSFFAAS